MWTAFPASWLSSTADAFALWVMAGQAGLSRPVFYGTPVTVDYDGLNQAIDEALLALGV